jgi:hypothetical protein
MASLQKHVCGNNEKSRIIIYLENKLNEIKNKTLIKLINK